MSKVISKLFVATILLAIIPVVCAELCDTPDWNCDPPNNVDIFQPNEAKLNTDGYPEWSEADFVKDMRDCQYGSSLYRAKTYVQLDDDANILYIKVLLNEGTSSFITDNDADHYVRDNCA